MQPSQGATQARQRSKFKTIPADAEAAILELADRYPGLGQNGLQDEVERMGVRADPHELKLFLHEHGRVPPEPGYRRRGMWDTGWPTWTNRNPVGDMTFPKGETWEHRFPEWAWMASQPLWFRIMLLLMGLAGPLFIAFPMIRDIVSAFTE
jgi:hypothetical protein